MPVRKSSITKLRNRMKREEKMTSWQNIVIGVLIVAVAALGYLYYQERQDRVEVKIDLPNLSIEKN